MTKQVAVIDTSCVIALEAIDALPLLPFLFDSVLLPKAVRSELFVAVPRKKLIRSLLSQYAFLVRCEDYDRVAVDVLMAERHARGVKDRGEAESVVQAAERSAMVVIDDPWGRELASRFALDFHGTLWVLHSFYSLGLRPTAQLRSDIQRLSKKQVRLPRDSTNDLLREFGQEPLL